MIRGTVAGPFDNDRFLGYCDALSDAGIPFDEQRVQDISEFGYSEDGGRQAALHFLQMPTQTRPTAYFCASDQIAYGALSVFQENGVRVPDELSLAGFDDEQKAVELSPPLTTLRQPYAQIGRQAAELLIEMLTGDVLEQRREFAGRLMVRGSVAPPFAVTTNAIAENRV